MIIIIGVGWFVWYDTALQQKELTTSLFLPQTSALGILIGMRLIDYLFIGCVLLISGLIIIVATRKKLTKQDVPTSHHMKRSQQPTTLIKWILLGSGLLFELYAVTTTSAIPVLTGLGLIFYGALLFYMTPEPYIQATLLDATSIAMLTSLNQLLRADGATSKAIYLPARSTIRKEEQAVFTTTTQSANRQTGFLISANQRLTHSPSKEIFIDPPGVKLTNLYEQTLQTQFIHKDLSYLEDNLPDLLINEFEVANELEFQVTDKQVYLKVVSSIYRTVIKESRDLEHIYASLGCPFLSSIALAIVRATRRPVIIEQIQTADDYETIDVYYRIL